MSNTTSFGTASFDSSAGGGVNASGWATFEAEGSTTLTWGAVLRVPGRAGCTWWERRVTEGGRALAAGAKRWKAAGVESAAPVAGVRRPVLRSPRQQLSTASHPPRGPVPPPSHDVPTMCTLHDRAPATLLPR